MNHVRLWLLSCLAVSPAFALAADRPQTYPLDPQVATHAVLVAHPELAGDSMELATRITLREPTPVLEAGPVERLGNEARIRVHCQGESSCLPFYVLVHLSPSQVLPTRQPVEVSAESAPVLHSGDHTSMVIDSGLLHLRFPVTCLQAGSVGSTIRVTGLARGKVYEAAVVDRTTVRGSL